MDQTLRTFVSSAVSDLCWPAFQCYWEFIQKFPSSFSTYVHDRSDLCRFSSDRGSLFEVQESIWYCAAWKLLNLLVSCKLSLIHSHCCDIRDNSQACTNQMTKLKPRKLQLATSPPAVLTSVFQFHYFRLVITWDADILLSWLWDKLCLIFMRYGQEISGCSYFSFYWIWEAEGGSLLVPVSMGINFIDQEVFKLMCSISIPT